MAKREQVVRGEGAISPEGEDAEGEWGGLRSGWGVKAPRLQAGMAPPAGAWWRGQKDGHRLATNHLHNTLGVRFNPEATRRQRWNIKTEAVALMVGLRVLGRAGFRLYWKMPFVQHSAR